MCGIFGCLRNDNNTNDITQHILKALNLLKNRGYDSCGVYLNDDSNNYKIIKYGVDGEIIKQAKEENINDIFVLLDRDIKSLYTKENYNVGIGHTRWATHGGKTDYNSHPHVSNNNVYTIVHNGIISNCDELKKKYLFNYTFKSNTDTEVIVNMIQYLKENNSDYTMERVLDELKEILEGTWACIIHSKEESDRLYFMKNESPLLLGINDNLMMLTSEPSGFMNMVEKYILLRDKTYGYFKTTGEYEIYGEYKELPLIKTTDDDIILPLNYVYWMRKEIDDQIKLNVLVDPITKNMRYDRNNVLLNYEFIRPCKYLYIIACGSSYYAGLIASNYFRYTRAFEFVNVYDGGEFTRAHLEAIENPERDLLVILISQSGETRDLNIATTICREYSSNRKNRLKPNKLIQDTDPINVLLDDNCKLTSNFNENNEIKIIGIINVIGSLISRRTIDNFYTNCGRENAVASTKSCTFQILACLLLSIYKAELNNNLDPIIKNKFLNDLNNLDVDITTLMTLENRIISLSENILSKNKKSIFLLGKDELHGAALEGALKIKEIAYIHAEGFHIAALKHGPYAMIEKDTPIILLYKKRDHFVKSIVEEIKTRGAYVIEMSPYALDNEDSIVLPNNKTFTGLIAVIALQLLSYHLSVCQNINPDCPRNLAKVVTVD